jgi:hypothetical protein
MATTSEQSASRGDTNTLPGSRGDSIPSEGKLLPGSLSQILSRYHRAVKLNVFDKIGEISSKVCIQSLNPLIVSADNANIDCKYDFSTDNFEIGMTVDVVGTLIMVSNNLVLHIKTMTAENQLIVDATQDEMWHKLRYHVATKPEREFIAKLTKMESPLFIKNIGLIVPPSNKRNLKAFNERMHAAGVKANVFVYNMAPNAKIETTLRNGLLYFQKYHNIDVICLLLDNVDPQTSIELSTVEVYNIFRQRKQSQQYIVSITNPVAEYKPIVAKLVNFACDSQDKFAEFILNARAKLEAAIKTSIAKVHASLNNSMSEVDMEIDTYKQNIDVNSKLLGIKILDEKQLFEDVRFKILSKMTEFDMIFARTTYRICKEFATESKKNEQAKLEQAMNRVDAKPIEPEIVASPVVDVAPTESADLMKTVYSSPPSSKSPDVDFLSDSLRPSSSSQEEQDFPLDEIVAKLNNDDI